MASVLGMGLCCALGSSLDACVDGLRARRVPPGEIQFGAGDEARNVPFYGIDDGADPFDPDRLQRLLPPVVGAALDAAGMSREARADLPVFVGSSCFAIARGEARFAAELRVHRRSALPMPEIGYEAVGKLAADAAGSAGRIASWHTACTSAANALLAAQRALAAGRIRHALVVGVELANRTSLGGFSALELITDLGRPADGARSAFVLGEGIGTIVLGADGHSPLRITGGAANVDTYSVTGANPDGARLAAVQVRALELASRRPQEVRAIKAHATGTVANDIAEARSLQHVFAHVPPVCAFKPHLGHTLGACGVVELALFAGALAVGFMPATPGFMQGDPDVAPEPVMSARPAVSGPYLLNQFGFGGANASLVLEFG